MPAEFEFRQSRFCGLKKTFFNREAHISVSRGARADLTGFLIRGFSQGGYRKSLEFRLRPLDPHPEQSGPGQTLGFEKLLFFPRFRPAVRAALLAGPRRHVIREIRPDFSQGRPLAPPRRQWRRSRGRKVEKSRFCPLFPHMSDCPFWQLAARKLASGPIDLLPGHIFGHGSESCARIALGAIAGEHWGFFGKISAPPKTSFEPRAPYLASEGSEGDSEAFFAGVCT